MPGDINPTCIFWWQILSLEKTLVPMIRKIETCNYGSLVKRHVPTSEAKDGQWFEVLYPINVEIMYLDFNMDTAIPWLWYFFFWKAFLPPDALERVNTELCKKLNLPQVVKKNKQHWVNKVNCQMLFYFVMKSIYPNVHIQISHSQLCIAVPGHRKKKMLLLHPILLPWKQPKRGFHLCFKSSVGCKCYKFPDAIMS